MVCLPLPARRWALALILKTSRQQLENPSKRWKPWNAKTLAQRLSQSACSVVGTMTSGVGRGQIRRGSLAYDGVRLLS